MKNQRGTASYERVWANRSISLTVDDERPVKLLTKHGNSLDYFEQRPDLSRQLALLPLRCPIFHTHLGAFKFYFGALSC